MPNSLEGYRSAIVNPLTGKRPIVWNLREGYHDLSRVKVPCGGCIFCRVDRSRQMAIRCVHESSLFDDNCFLTLTYRDEHVPVNKSLDYDALPDFMRSLRKRFGSGIRSYGCGEYGSFYDRPHYHLLLFNFNFPDRYYWKDLKGHSLYRSDVLESLWPYGFSTIGELSFDSAAYVARYVMKKLNGSKAQDKYYGYCNLDSYSEVFYLRQPEKAMAVSRMPGLGASWFQKFKSDLYPGDRVVLNGKKLPVPRYYDKLLEVDDPELFSNVKRHRRLKRLSLEEEDSLKRIDQRILAKEAEYRSLTRELQDDF